MFNGKRIICIIPARGGSEGLPGKNILTIAGKPMIAHAIEKAMSTCEIDRLVISTDNEKIAAIGRKYGAEVPFMREAKLAQSDTPMVPVIIDVIEKLQAQGNFYDYAVMLQANSPLTSVEVINYVINKIVTSNLDVVFTICRVHHPPQWTLRIDKDEPIFAFLHDEECVGERRQDQEILYKSTGAVYAVNIPFLLAKRNAVRLCLPAPSQKSGFVITDELTSIDIDTEMDFLLAETILRKKLIQ